MKSLRQVRAAARYAPYRKTKVSEQTAKQSTIETGHVREGWACPFYRFRQMKLCFHSFILWQAVENRDLIFPLFSRIIHPSKEKTFTKTKREDLNMLFHPGGSNSRMR